MRVIFKDYFISTQTSLLRSYYELNIKYFPGCRCNSESKFWRDVSYMWNFKSFIPFVVFFPCVFAWSGVSGGVGRRK